MKTDSGFTLLELMVTVAIGAILLAIAIPNMINFVRNSRLATQTNEFVTTLALARSEAVKRGVPVGVCRSATESATPTCSAGGGGWEIGWFMWADNNSNAAFDAGEQLILVHGPINGSNTLAGVGNVVNRVIFTPQGVVGAGGIGSFTLTDTRGAPDGIRLICMAMTGRTRVISDGTACL